MLNMLVPESWLQLFPFYSHHNVYILWCYHERQIRQCENETFLYLWHTVIPIFEWGAVLKKSCVFCVVQILNNRSCRDMWMIICILEQYFIKCVDIWEATSHNLLEINVWYLASALSLWFSWYMYGLYCVSFKIWLHLPTCNCPGITALVDGVLNTNLRSYI